MWEKSVIIANTTTTATTATTATAATAATSTAPQAATICSEPVPPLSFNRPNLLWICQEQTFSVEYPPFYLNFFYRLKSFQLFFNKL